MLKKKLGKEIFCNQNTVKIKIFYTKKNKREWNRISVSGKLTMS